MNIGARALEIAHGFNKNPVNHAFDYVLPLARPMANKLYEEYKTKPTKVLERDEQILKPKGFLDRISYSFDAERTAKHGAVIKNLLERQE